MNTKTALLIIVIAAAAGYVIFGRSTEPVPAPQQSEVPQEAQSPSNEAACAPGGDKGAFITDVAAGPFRYVDETTGAGEAVVTGTVVEREAPLFMDTVQALYLKLDPLQASTEGRTFLKYFSEIRARGNGVNLDENGQILFKLGAFGPGMESFSSTADISEMARAKIAAAFESGFGVTLNIHVPVFAGGGAPPDFSFACSVQAAP